MEYAGIVQRDENKIDNSHLYMGIWWFMLLISVWLMNFVLYSTFFREGAFFVKTNHAAIVIVAIVIMIVTMIYESSLILQYNKKNKQLLDNESKF